MLFANAEHEERIRTNLGSARKRFWCILKKQFENPPETMKILPETIEIPPETLKIPPEDFKILLLCFSPMLKMKK